GLQVLPGSVARLQRGDAGEGLWLIPGTSPRHRALTRWPLPLPQNDATPGSLQRWFLRHRGWQCGQKASPEPPGPALTIGPPPVTPAAMWIPDGRSDWSSAASLDNGWRVP